MTDDIVQLIQSAAILILGIALIVHMMGGH